MNQGLQQHPLQKIYIEKKSHFSLNQFHKVSICLRNICIYMYIEPHLPKSKVYRKTSEFHTPHLTFFHTFSPPSRFNHSLRRQRDLAPYIPSAKPRSWAHWFPKLPIGVAGCGWCQVLLMVRWNPNGYSTPNVKLVMFLSGFLNHLTVSQQRHWIPLGVYLNPMLHKVWLIFLCWLKWRLCWKKNRAIFMKLPQPTRIMHWKTPPQSLQAIVGVSFRY